MDRYPISGNGLSVPATVSGNLAALAASQPLPPLLENHRKSLEAMAERDLRATLQLLAERAQFLTDSSGVMIALIENGRMICRASVGEALRVGTALQIDQGLTGQSLRLKELLRCNDTEQDSRVNRDSCTSLGIRSVLVVPLLRNGSALGIFELFADRRHAFEEQDESSLEWLSQCVVTALDQADAARLALNGELITKSAVKSLEREKTEEAGITEPTSQVDATNKPARPLDPAPIAAISPEPKLPTANAKQCATCGFPVSPGRTLCIDCEAAQMEKEPAVPSFAASSFLASAQPRQQTWFDRHMYTIGTIAVAALTGLALYLKFH
jgi:putative methionine-R-sulfoxide reductase with GAF domain